MPVKYEIRYSEYVDFEKTLIETKSIFTNSFIESIKLFFAKKRNKSLIKYAIYFEAYTRY